ncbi:MAG: hypothetical protein AMXMBFR34_06110 [Myxococcaceae bacterium]
MRYRSLVLATALFAVPTLAFLPGVLVWTKLGDTTVRKGSCSSTGACKWSKAIDRRYSNFGFSNDGAQGVTLAGRTWIECKNGVVYEYFLSSASAPGIFQAMGNTCENYDVKSINLEINQVQIPEVDEDRGVTLMLYAAEL